MGFQGLVFRVLCLTVKGLGFAVFRLMASRSRLLGFGSQDA